MDKVNDAVLNFFAPTYWTIGYFFMNRLRVGDILPTQIVNDDRVSDKLPTNIDYFAAVFMGDYKGGNIDFIKKDIEVEVNPGDMLVFSGKPEYIFNVKPLTEGIRYSAVNLVISPPSWIVV